MRCTTIAAIVVAALAGSGAIAQEASKWAETARQISETQKQNAAELRQHSWKRRVEVKTEGEPARRSLRMVHYDAAGRLQETMVADRTGKIRSGRGLREAKRMQGNRDKTELVARLVSQYALPRAGKVDAFLAKATFEKGKGKMKSAIRIEGSRFARKNDTVTLWVDRETKRILKVEFQTALEGDPLEGTVDYRSLDSGLNIPAHAAVAIPSRKLNAVVETFDYEKQEHPGGAGRLRE